MLTTLLTTSSAAKKSTFTIGYYTLHIEVVNLSAILTGRHSCEKTGTVVRIEEHKTNCSPLTD